VDACAQLPAATFLRAKKQLVLVLVLVLVAGARAVFVRFFVLVLVLVLVLVAGARAVFVRFFLQQPHITVGTCITSATTS
jgi:hypothetical protein